MRTAAVAFALALLAGAFLTPLARKHAHRFGAVDHALSSRKVHGRPTPRLGGVAIVAAFFVPLLALFFVNRTFARRLVATPGVAAALLVGGIAIAAVGVYDDVRGASARLKFLVQFGVAGLACSLGFQITSIVNPFGEAIQLGWFALPFTVFFIVGAINAINLIDGLDGLAGGIAFLCAVTFFVAAAMRGRVLTMWLTAALAGSILGFLLYNFNPASVFMGDTGSMFIGFVLALTAIRSHGNEDASVSIAAPIVALGVPILDTLLAIARRAARGVPVFRADREHIHHKLLAMGLSHRSVVLVLYAASFMLGAAALALGSVCGARVALVVLVLVAAGGASLIHRLGYLDLGRFHDTLATRRRNLLLGREMAHVRGQLRGATELEDVAVAIARAASILDARWASVELVLPEGGGPLMIWAGDGRRAPTSLVRSRHGLVANRPEEGFLELVWPPEHGTLGRDAEIAIETLCEQLRAALERVVSLRARGRVISLRPRSSALLPPAKAPVQASAKARRMRDAA